MYFNYLEKADPDITAAMKRGDQSSGNQNRNDRIRELCKL